MSRKRKCSSPCKKNKQSKKTRCRSRSKRRCKSRSPKCSSNSGASVNVPAGTPTPGPILTPTPTLPPPPPSDPFGVRDVNEVCREWVTELSQKDFETFLIDRFGDDFITQLIYKYFRGETAEERLSNYIGNISRGNLQLIKTEDLDKLVRIDKKLDAYIRA